MRDKLWETPCSKCLRFYGLVGPATAKDSARSGVNVRRNITNTSHFCNITSTCHFFTTFDSR